MPNMPARMLRLLSLLQGRREWSGADLAERLGVTARTIRRDIDRLRELGYPVHASTGTAGGYRLASGKNLPPLLLDDAEAVAVAVGLRTAAGGSVSGLDEASVRALAKLEQVLPSRLRSQVAALGRATVPVRLPGEPGAEPATLAALATACRDHEVVTFDYRSRDGTPSARRVEPHSMGTLYGRWYLIGYDVDRAGWRTFRLDRMRSPTPTHRRFTPRALPAPDTASYLADSIAAAPYRYTATVSVDAAAEEVVRRMWAPIPGRVSAVDERHCTVGFGADTLELLTQQLMTLLATGLEFRITAEQDVLAHLYAFGHKLAGL